MSGVKAVLPSVPSATPVFDTRGGESRDVRRRGGRERAVVGNLELVRARAGLSAVALRTGQRRAQRVELFVLRRRIQCGAVRVAATGVGRSASSSRRRRRPAARQGGHTFFAVSRGSFPVWFLAQAASRTHGGGLVSRLEHDDVAAFEGHRARSPRVPQKAENLFEHLAGPPRPAPGLRACPAAAARARRSSSARRKRSAPVHRAAARAPRRCAARACGSDAPR